MAYLSCDGILQAPPVSRTEEGRCQVKPPQRPYYSQPL